MGPFQIHHVLNPFMKRKILSILLVSLVIVAAGAITPWLIRYSREQVMVLGGIFLLSGLVISKLAIFAILKLFHIDKKKFSTPNRWALNLFAVFASFVVAGILNSIFARPLARLLFSQVSSRVFFRLSDFIEMGGFLFLLLNLFYVLLRLYEETVAKRAKRFLRPSFFQGGWKLGLKLIFGGVAVYLLTRLATAGDWAEFAQQPFIQSSATWREKNDSLGSIYLVSEGKSHDWYFENVYKLNSVLSAAGVRVFLIPVPHRVQSVESSLRWLEKISKFENVVFAVPPEETSEYPELWVRDPVNNKFAIQWGVISAQRISKSLWSYNKFYPMAFREEGRGYIVPDVAIVATRRFLGDAFQTSLKDLQEKGLYLDRSAPILYELNVSSIAYARVSPARGGQEFEWFEGGSMDRIPVKEVLARFAGKIVILYAGETITPSFYFGQWYAQILHQMLRGYRVTPLDRWTSEFIVASILMTVLIFWAYRWWISSIIILLFTIGQGFLCAWLSNQYGLVVEAVPLLVAGVFSIPILAFVHVNHERSILHVAEKQRALTELQTARDMQMGLLPNMDPIVKGFDISGICIPASEVGGDFYDYVWLDGKQTKLGIALADVSGKAMKAAMTAVMTSGMLYSEAAKSTSPREILARINRPLYLRSDRRVFTALSFSVLDTKSRKLTYSSAGQSQPILIRNGALSYLKTEGVRLPLGIKEELKYQDFSVKLRKGDTVVFYTDGVPEAMNNENKFYGFERFEELLKQHQSQGAKELKDRVVFDVQAFAGKTEQPDDMTVVVVKVV